jgi:hypothetical protein
LKLSLIQQPDIHIFSSSDGKFMACHHLFLFLHLQRPNLFACIIF